MSDESPHDPQPVSTWATQINEFNAARQRIATLEARLAKCVEAAQEEFIPGSRVINCVVHSGDWRLRPRDCSRCLTDLQNHLSYCVRVNEFLNARHEKIIVALDAQEA